jgi:hypothetical protein
VDGRSVQPVTITDQYGSRLHCVVCDAAQVDVHYRAAVQDRLAYVSGASPAADGAVRTLLARRGVCRDFAHLTAALLRTRDVPARLVSVYLRRLDVGRRPGLSLRRSRIR